MPKSAPRYNGKFKRDIAKEAFEKFGPTATIQQVDEYFQKKYGLPNCERSMYSAARRLAQGRPAPIPRRYRRTKLLNIPALVARTRELAIDVGGWDDLEELVAVLRGDAT